MVRRLVRRGVIVALGVLGVELVYAVLRPTPILDHFDPSDEFGDPGLPSLRVAVLGDSSVTAPGVKGPHETWVSQVCHRLAENRHVILRSFAVGGARTQDVLAFQVAPTLRFAPDVVFLSVGANDALKGVPIRRFAADLDRLVSELTSNGATVIQSGVGVLGTIPRLHPPLSGLMSRRAERFDRVHWEVAVRHGSTVVDQRSDEVLPWRDRSLWAADLFHVSAAGHARWADTVWRTVGPMLDGADGQG